ncbi:MAG: hypothetical protein CTY10_00830 [Methylotenera sp.]|nr:MAG: hypothetical protein CTY10_00830 [Methylotenera sp.]
MTFSEIINLTITGIDFKNTRLNIMCINETGEEFWCIGSLNLKDVKNLKLGDSIKVTGYWIISPDGQSTVLFVENILD